MTTLASSTIVQRLRKSCSVLRGERRLEARRAVETELKRAGRLRQAVPCAPKGVLREG